MVLGPVKDQSNSIQFQLNLVQTNRSVLQVVLEVWETGSNRWNSVSTALHNAHISTGCCPC